MRDAPRSSLATLSKQESVRITTQLVGQDTIVEALKPDLGFVAFDQFKSLLADENGKLSGPRTVLAGFGAGVTESLLAVTPTESIKTTLYALLFLCFSQ